MLVFRRWGSVGLVAAALALFCVPYDAQALNLYWQAVPDMLHPARLSCGVYLDNSIYMIGGEHFAPYSWHNVVQRYDLATKSWSYVAPMQQSISRAEAVVFGGEIWRLSGCDPSTQAVPTVEIYNPITETWRWGPTMLSAHFGHGAVVVDGKIYVMCFSEPQADTSEVYDPATGTWSYLPQTDLVYGTVQVAARGHQILTVDWTGHSAVFDTLTNSWSPGPALPIWVGPQGWPDLWRMTGDGNLAYFMTAPFTAAEPVRTFVIDMATLDEWVEATNVPAVPYPHNALTLVLENGNLHMLGRSYNAYADPGGHDTLFHEVATLIPEPSALALTAIGLLGIATRRRRRVH